MIEKILVLILPLMFLGLFIARNLIVKARAGESIRSQDRWVTASIMKNIKIKPAGICRGLEKVTRNSF